MRPDVRNGPMLGAANNIQAASVVEFPQSGAGLDGLKLTEAMRTPMARVLILTRRRAIDYARCASCFC